MIRPYTMTSIWDLPIRLFHWLLLVLVTISVTTGLLGGYMDYHMMSGLGIIALLLFRVGWGFIGSHHARFVNFVRGPSATLDYVRQVFRPGPNARSASNEQGHNPLGALGIIAMLGVLMFQGITGLFANDDFFTEGPLAYLVSYDISRDLTGLHKSAKWVLGALILLHLTAIAWHQFGRSENLIGPMITGRKAVSVPVDAENARHYPIRAVLLATICGALVYGISTLG